jgi:DNA invertase Pin-like site-specific DNA recombinase
VASFRLVDCLSLSSSRRVTSSRACSIWRSSAARQLEAVGECDRVYIEKQSARSRADHVKLAGCIRYLRDGDELAVASMDRLARSLVDLKQIVGEITAKGASVEFIHERATYAAGAQDPRADLMLSLLGAFAEFERAIIRERQAEGIAIAKTKGKYKGRKRVLTAEQIDKARGRFDKGALPESECIDPILELTGVDQ